MLDLIKASLWPAIALIAIVLFYVPIRSMLDNLANRAGDIQTVKLGSLEMTIKVSELPVPDRETAKAIVKLNDDTITELLSESRNENGGRCYIDPVDQDHNYIADKQLSDYGLMIMVKNLNPPEFCKNGVTSNLTDIGKKVKTFLIELLSSQIHKAGYLG